MRTARTVKPARKPLFQAFADEEATVLVCAEPPVTMPTERGRRFARQRSATGYTLTQKDLADALGLRQPDVSVLVRAFKLADDVDCTVRARRAKKAVVSYHQRAIARLRELIANPPKGLKPTEMRALERARKAIMLSAPTMASASPRS